LNTLFVHLDQIQSVAFSPDNLIIASGGSNHNIKIWDARASVLPMEAREEEVEMKSKRKGAHSAQLLNTLKGHTDWIRCVAFSNLITYPIDAKLKEHIKKLNK
jgi:WD40 repeat protein